MWMLPRHGLMRYGSRRGAFNCKKMNDPHHSVGKSYFSPDLLAVLAVALGVGAAVLFSYTGLACNLVGGVFMLLFVLARNTRQRMLESSGKATPATAKFDRWTVMASFFFIYVSICLRVAPQLMPGTLTPWGIGIWLLCIVAAFLCHSPQARLHHYYKQVHKWWSEGAAVPPDQSMEKHTPSLQRLRVLVEELYGSPLHLPEDVRRQLSSDSRRLLRPARLLSFESRALVLSLACIVGLPWVYPLFEIVVLCCAYVYMHKSHESLCVQAYRKIKPSPQNENID